MRQFNLTLFLLLTISALSNAQHLNKLGHPLITNFPPESYNGAEQTWSIVQDNRGVMYFGTETNGVLEYDGNSWRKINVTNGMPVYSMVKGNNGTIYVGTSGDFGYLEPNIQGKLEYVSLAQNLPDSIKQGFTHVFKTYSYKENIYFCTFAYIFKYDGKEIFPIYLGDRKETGNFFTFLIDNTIYVGSYLKGLAIYNEDGSHKLAPGSKSFEGKDIYNILKLDESHLLVITSDGYYKYNYKNGTTAFLDDPDGFFKKMTDQLGLPYHSILFDNKIGIGMVQSDMFSFIELNKNGSPQNIINKGIGLHGSQVPFLFKENEAPLWLALFDGGIAKAEINSGIRRFAKESGIDDIINDIISFEGIIYIATFNGVYYLNSEKNSTPSFKLVENINGLTWDLTIFYPPNSKPILLAGTYTNGIYEIKGNKGISISDPLKKEFPDVQHNVFCLYQSKQHPEILYIGKNHGLSNLTWKSGKWIKTENLFKDEINGEIKSIFEDKHGNLWLSIPSKGLRVINSNQNIINFSNSKYLEGLKDIYFFDKNDSLILISTKGIYEYNYEDSSFTPNGMPKPYSNTKGVFRIQKTKKGYALVCNDENSGKYWIELLEQDSSGKWTVNSTPFKRLPAKQADGFYVDNEGIIWIGMSKELYSYNPSIERNYSKPYHAIIRKVIAKDSLLFEGYFYSVNENGKKIQSIEQKPIQTHKLPYKYNGVVITYAAPFFEKESDLQYSHYLEGSDETTWSKWDNRTETTYTNLREGKYTFYVKAKNIYDNESIVASYSFEIRPPWYRTIIAYILYVILFVALVWGIVKWNTRRLIAEKEHLEQIVKERTAEVVAQKEEIEVQKEKIAAQNEEIKSSIQYASRIQGAILTPAEQVNRIFPNNFILYLPRDIVSGDFYYITQIGSKKISVVADCTGHGVPGGFMSMLGVSFLTQIISQTEELHAATILNKLRQQVITALHQTGEIGGSKDGMDLALYILDEQTMKLEFAGANNPLIHISDGQLNHIKSDKMPIGIHLRGDTPFTNIEIEVKKGDVLYTFSDGYADQFGGGDARKFMIKNLKDLLLEIHQKPMDEQRDILDKTLLNWHGDTPRIDDVVVMGMRI